LTITYGDRLTFNQRGLTQTSDWPGGPPPSAAIPGCHMPTYAWTSITVRAIYALPVALERLFRTSNTRGSSRDNSRTESDGSDAMSDSTTLVNDDTARFPLA